MLHDLLLPFEGAALVGWGGDSKEQNHHHEHPVQKYGFDFIGVPSSLGVRWTGAGTANHDFLFFDRPILSPHDGLVVEAVDGVRDNLPKQMYERLPTGNYLLIKHSDSVWSHLSHLKLGTISVRAGDKVTRGQVVGRCGNSGRSTEPHLHFHVQSDDRTGTPIAVKCWFRKVWLTNEVRNNYSPIRGDIIHNEA